VQPVDFPSLFSLRASAGGRFVTCGAHIPGPRLFGGQLIAQSLLAAEQTVSAPFVVHSLHAYFVNAGHSTQPVEFRIKRIREGRRFVNRRVEAWQGRRLLLNFQASFQAPTGGSEHSMAMPDVPPPELLPNISTRALECLAAVNEGARERWLADPGWEFRAVEPFAPSPPQARAPLRHFWFRAKFERPEVLTARAALAFVSDLHLLETALLPHGVRWPPVGLHGASLDHAIWFYAEPRIDEWMLYAIDSPRAGSSRFFARGSIFNRRGEVLALTTQEGTFSLPALPANETCPVAAPRRPAPT